MTRHGHGQPASHGQPTRMPPNPAKGDRPPSDRLAKTAPAAPVRPGASLWLADDLQPVRQAIAYMGSAGMARWLAQPRPATRAGPRERVDSRRASAKRGGA